MMKAKRPYHPQNPVRHEELEEILTVLTQKILDEFTAGLSPSHKAKDIARQTIDHVYAR